jgi:hypothetical protein
LDQNESAKEGILGGGAVPAGRCVVDMDSFEAKVEEEAKTGGDGLAKVNEL